jgi:hypothetical protein
MSCDKCKHIDDLEKDNADLRASLESEIRWASHYCLEAEKLKGEIKLLIAPVESGGGYVAKIEAENAALREQNDKLARKLYFEERACARKDAIIKGKVGEIDRLSRQVKNLQHSWGGTLPNNKRERKLAMAEKVIEAAIFVLANAGYSDGAFNTALAAWRKEDK